MQDKVPLKYYELRPEAEMDLQLLLDEGIPAFLEGANEGVFEGNLVSGPVTIYVSEEDLETAKEIIDEN